MFLVFILLGLFPSIVWLAYYLRKDVHPEPRGVILSVFLGGMLIVPIAAIAEIAFSQFLEIWKEGGMLKIVAWNFLGIALIEEIGKYAVVRWKVLRRKEFDEPIDAMIYLVIAALGFAALENVLILVSPLVTNYFSGITAGIEAVPRFEFSQALELTLIRFWGATLLHTLASGALGFFLALSFYHHGRFRYHSLILPAGIIFATLLHGLFNYLILLIEAASSRGEAVHAYVVLLVGLLGASAYAVNKSFKMLKSRWAQKEIEIK